MRLLSPDIFRPLSLRFLCLGVALLPACGGRDATGPRLEASWIGSDTGKISAPARVAWCPVASRLEVTAVREDLGFGLVMYPLGELQPGNYPGFDPGIDTTHRPGVAAAARWFTEEKLAGFQGDSGELELTRATSGYDARFTLRMRSLDTEDTLMVTGRATGLVAGPCPVDSVPPATPAQ